MRFEEFYLIIDSGLPRPPEVSEERWNAMYISLLGWLSSDLLLPVVYIELEIDGELYELATNHRGFDDGSQMGSTSEGPGTETLADGRSPA